MTNDVATLEDSLANQKVLVTGGSSGIGRAVCIALSHVGAKVAIVGRDEDRLQQTLGLMQGSGHTVFSFDLSNIDRIESLIKDIFESDNKKFDAFVHSAGNANIMPLRSVNYRHMDDIMRINLYAFLEMSKHILKKKYSDACNIVAISSVASTLPEKGQVLYASSKAALDAAVKTMAQEYAHRNVRINTVNPGVVNTRMTQLANEHIDALASRQVLGTGNPEQVANAVLFLLSGMAQFITGSNMVVDGGRF